jgi:hypothetical protein
MARTRRTLPEEVAEGKESCIGGEPAGWRLEGLILIIFIFIFIAGCRKERDASRR